MLDIPRRSHNHVLRMVRPLVERTKVRSGERADCLTGAENRVAVGMLSPEPRTVQLEHQIVGRILDGAYLLENDLALELEI